MDKATAKRMAEELRDNPWFNEVFDADIRGLENRVASASLSSVDETMEAAIALRYLKQVKERMLKPLDD